MCSKTKTGSDKPPHLYRRIFVMPIKFYRLTLSFFMGRNCRFEPTCSAYSVEAIERHGVWRGFWLSLSRIWRCSPWGDSGYDPVPEKLEKNVFWGWKYGRWTAKHKK